jgi:hypothetical protein
MYFFKISFLVLYHIDNSLKIYNIDFVDKNYFLIFLLVCFHNLLIIDSID